MFNIQDIMGKIGGMVGNTGSTTKGFGEGNIDLNLNPASTGTYPSAQLIDPATGGSSNQGTGILGAAAQANQSGQIMGMNPDTFSAMMGGMGAALAPKGSWQEKLGTFARGLGVTNIAATANKVKADADQKLITEFLKTNPELAAKIASETGQNPMLPMNPDMVPK